MEGENSIDGAVNFIVMKVFAVLILLLVVGCGTPNIERLSRQLSENNASFILEVEHGRVKIQRLNPTIGFSVTASTNGLSQSSATNLALAIQYVAQVPPPAMPQPQTQSTNAVNRK